MIYNKDEYKVKFYQDFRINKSPVYDYIERLNSKIQAKVYKYLEHLRCNGEYLDEPYSRHITGKVRELRVDFANSRHRIFYFTFIDKKIILLHAFLKKTKKTPKKEINKALDNYNDVINNPQLYD
ncbi:MAG: type II toxin-antitoxin system RelE/ParE family toxin [bacterium]|nr:type II toxin-antitoxin system RelE/ParE family toxin [bacterium]